MLRDAHFESDTAARVVRLPLSDGPAPDHVEIDDAQFLFTAHFKKSGPDLILTGDNGQKLVLVDYFNLAKRPDLTSHGATMSADLVARLAGPDAPGQYAQAGAPAGAQVIGKCDRIGGSATVQHANGVVEELKAGDVILKGDVVMTNDGSSAVLSLMDGTVFNMGASARMVLNELIYDSNSNSNSALFSLVKGTFTFVAGQVAHTGDMKVDTPIATMGIRGTTIGAYLEADIAGNVYQFTATLLNDPGGGSGRYQILDRVTGVVLYNVTSTASQVTFTPAATGATGDKQIVTLKVTPISDPSPTSTTPTPTTTPGPTTTPTTTPTTQPIEVPVHFDPVILPVGAVIPGVTEAGAGGPGTPTSQVTFAVLGDGTAHVDTSNLLAHGWVDSGGNTFTKVGAHGTFTLDAGGASPTLTYALNNDDPAVNALRPGQSLTEPVAVPVIDDTSATASASFEIPIEGTNDAPVIAVSEPPPHLTEGGAPGDAAGAVTFADETPPAPGATSVAHLQVSDVDGLEAPHYDASVLTGAGWTNEGEGIFSKAGTHGTAILDIANNTVTYHLNNASVLHLAQGEHAIDSFDVLVVDDLGAIGSTSVVFTIDGVNEAPVVTGAVQGAATEDGTPVSLDALANASDVDDGAILTVTDVPDELPAGVTFNPATREFTLDPSNTAYRHLGAGEEITVTVAYGVTDGIAPTPIPASVSWTITGTNDAPVVSGAAQGTATEDGAPVTLDALANSSDVDDDAVLSVTDLPGTLPAGVTFDAETHSFTLDPSNAAYQHVAAGQTTTVTVNYAVSDGTAATAASVSWTITGTNDGPIVTGAVHGDANEDGAAATLDALLNASDPDDGATLTVTNLPETLPAGVTFNAATHSFTLDPSNAAYQSLADGQQTTVTVNYGVTDGTATTPASVSWTITGTNDAPVVLPPPQTTPTGSITAVPPSTVGNPLTALAVSYLVNGNVLVNGLGGGAGFGENVVAVGDDNSTGAINITSVFGAEGLNFFGNSYTSLYINNNGNITFASATSQFTPSVISAGANNPIIAPFWADVDTRGGAAGATPGGNSTGSNKVYYDLDSVNGVLTVTWDDVGYYNSQTNKLNAFQVQLISLGDGDFDVVLRYEDINWTTGSASGGSNGLGGSPARAGYSAGDGVHYFELPQSGNQAQMLALETTTGNSGIAGLDVFQVHNGDVVPVALTTSGHIVYSDLDTGDVHSVGGVTYTGPGAALGTLSLVKDSDTNNPTHTGQFTWTYSTSPASLAVIGAGETRIETFDVTISDGKGGTVVQTVSVTLNGINDAPAGSDATITIGAGGGHGLTAAEFGFTDPLDGTDNNLLAVKITTLPGAGSLTNNGVAVTAGQIISVADINAGKLVFTPVITASGNNYAHFTFQVQDDGGTANGGSNLDPTPNTLTINLIADAVPVAQSGVASGNEDSPTPITGQAVATDADTPADHVTYSLVGSNGGATHGTVVMNSDGTFSYSPAANFNGTDTFNFRANDGGFNSNTAAITVTVNPASDNQAPVFDTATQISRIAVPDPQPDGTHDGAFNGIGPSISADGRYTAFIATDALPNSETSQSADIYFYDRLAGTVTALTDSAHIPDAPDGETYEGIPSVSLDGQFVAFRGEHTVSGTDGEGNPYEFHESDLFVYDVANDEVTRIPGLHGSEPKISGGGDVIVVSAFPTTFSMEGPTFNHVLVTDRESGAIVTDISGNAQLQTPAIDALGHVITFWTTASQIDVDDHHFVVGDGSGHAQVYAYNRVTGTLDAVSADDGIYLDGNSGALTLEDDGNDWASSLSGDGRYVAFQSKLAGSEFAVILVKDLETGALQQVSNPLAGELDGDSIRPQISSDGRYVVFASAASDLVAGDDNNQPDTFIYDRDTQTTMLLSQSALGTLGNGDSSWGEAVSGGGIYAVFGSGATNLTGDPSNGFANIYLLDRSGGTSGLVVEEQRATTLTTGGVIPFTDADSGDSHNVSVALLSAVDSNGDPVSNEVFEHLASQLCAQIIDDTNGVGHVKWDFAADESDFEYLQFGDNVTVTYELILDDGQVGTTQNVTITIVGTPVSPSITDESISTGAVQSGGLVVASNHLFASDPDTDDTQTWTIDGGHAAHAPSYHFAIDTFHVTKNGGTLFDDTFDGSVPPIAPAGSTFSYAVNGGSFVGGSDVNENNVALIDGAYAGFTGGGSGSTFGQFATLLTAIDDSDVTKGLRVSQAFAVDGTFDLIAPGANQSYGIRFSDRLTGTVPGVPPQPGTQIVELAVISAPGGTTEVQLRELNAATNQSTVLATSDPLTLSVGDEIILDLNHLANDHTVSASYQIVHHGVASDVTVLGATAQIFDDENWTRAQFFGTSQALTNPAPGADSLLKGQYGTLDLRQDGTWTYLLAEGQANVQALYAGQVAHDVFTAHVTDSTGLSSDGRTIDVAVTGKSDPPTIAGDLALALSKGGSTTLTTVDLRAIDPDSTAGELTFVASNVTNGHLALAGAPGTAINQFNEAQLEAGQVMFVHDGSETTGAGFDVSVTDATELTSASVTVNANVSPVEANLWRDVKFPDMVSGRHVFTPSLQLNSLGGFVAIAFTTTYGYDPASADPVTRDSYGALLDPFFLPDHQAPQYLMTNTVTLPARQFLITPNVGGTTPEGIEVYVTQANLDGTGPNVINRIVLGEDSNGNLTTTTLASVGDQSTTGATIFNLNENFRNTGTGALQTYDVAWDQYDAASQTYKVYFQTFNADNTASAANPVLTPINLSSVQVDGDGNPILPAWQFGSGLGAYTLAAATPTNTTNSGLGLTGQTYDAIHFQGYNANGTTNSNSFTILPNVSAHPGAVTHITQEIIPSIGEFPGQTVQAMQFTQASAANLNALAVAWNETVTYTDAGGHTATTRSSSRSTSWVQAAASSSVKSFRSPTGVNRISGCVHSRIQALPALTILCWPTATIPGLISGNTASPPPSVRLRSRRLPISSMRPIRPSPTCWFSAMAAWKSPTSIRWRPITPRSSSSRSSTCAPPA